MKKILLSLLAVLLLASGCTSSEEAETKTVCSAENQGITDAMILTSKGDEVNLVTEEVELPFEAFEVTEDLVEEFATMMVSQFDAFNEVEGVSVESETTETSLIIRINIDTTQTSYEDLVSMGFAEESEEEIIYISLEETIAGFESQGYTCATE